MGEYTTELTIAATPAEVFRYLTDADAMIEWMGRRATLEPVAGGRFEVDIEGAPVRGEYLEVDPPNRLVFSWGGDGNDVIPPGSTRVEITLVANAQGTLLRLVHSDLPEEQVERHEQGWMHFLGRLRSAAEAA